MLTTDLLIHIFACVFFIPFFCFAIVSKHEKEIRAFRRSFIIGILLTTYFELCIFLPTDVKTIIIWSIGVLIILCGTLFLYPSKLYSEAEIPSNRIDERDTMFSRLEITKKKDLSAKYYSEKPEMLEKDKSWQSKPGLLSPDALMFDLKYFTAADASFSVIEEMRTKVTPTPSGSSQNVNPQEVSQFIKKWAKKLGALDVGFCKMQPYHYYSIRGRGIEYGKTVENKHTFGIAITVEMDKYYLATGPAAPTLMESAQQYVNSGIIAMQITYFIAKLGYSARAHIDGNYEVVCPLVAKDAGLGEIGRMGLLMTPTLGPRVRIAVITTDIPLVTNTLNHNNSIQDFCNICKKCANACPAKAIPKGEKKIINNVARWQINQEKCFTYWCTTGTDCGRCMSVCPYSHPDNLIHNMVRWGTRKSAIFRLFALKMDTFFYGRKPKPMSQIKLN